MNREEARTAEDLPPSALPSPKAIDLLHRRLREDARVIHRLQTELDDTKRLENSIFECLDTGLVLTEEDFSIVFANAAFINRFRANGQNVAGRSILEVCVSHELESIGKQALEEGATGIYHLDLEATGGDDDDRSLTTRNFEVRGIRAESQEGPRRRLLYLFDDQTRLRELETIRRDFVANASHELRTPLSIITGYVENLIDGAVDNRELALRFLDIMRKHCARLNNIIKDLLTVSRLENYSMALEIEAIDLGDCIRGVTEQLQPVIREHETEIQTEFSPEPLTINGDRFCFDQIFFNLIENSIKHNKQDNITVFISASQEKDGATRIIYRDNGMGIPLQDQPFVFNRFYRVTRGGRPPAEGTGLGLAIVRKAVDAHGGTVKLVSQPNAGLRLEFYFPPRRLEGVEVPGPANNLVEV